MLILNKKSPFPSQERGFLLCLSLTLSGMERVRDKYIVSG
jgi:hypothetical protein